MVFGVSVFGLNLLRAFKKRPGALFRLSGSRDPLLRPRCKRHHSVVIGVRSGALLGQNGPGTREGCTFSKGLFLVVFRESTLYVVFCVPLGAPGPLRAPSGGAPGPNDQTKVTATLRPVLGRVLRLRAGSRGSPRPRITTYRCAESFSRDRCVFKTLVKCKGFEPFWHPRGPKHVENACLCVFFVPRRLQKGPPEGHEHKTLVNSDRIGGVIFLSSACFCQGALAFCVALFWRPPRCPKGVSGTPFGSSCGRPGVPRRGHRTVVIRYFWGLSGAPWGARWDLARFLRFLLAPFLDKLEVGLRG